MKKSNRKSKIKCVTKRMKGKETGITLISLVITIIVLLILAGVSIATLTGENEILTQATRAKEQTKKASIEEQRQLAQVEASMNLENTEYKGVTIPAGFAPTRIEGEDTVENGLVITDSEGNEFVWIPVTDETPYVRNTTYANTSVSASAIDDTDYLPTGITIPEGKTEGQVEEELVKNAGGFYIARYEADKVCNIYDLEGNAYERVAEQNDYDTSNPFFLQQFFNFKIKHNVTSTLYFSLC